MEPVKLDRANSTLRTNTSGSKVANKCYIGRNVDFNETQVFVLSTASRKQGPFLESVYGVGPTI